MTNLVQSQIGKMANINHNANNSASFNNARQPDAGDIARSLYQAATPVISLHSLGGKRWKRDVAKGARIGPWLSAQYSVLNRQAWEAKGPCLYMVTGKDLGIRYVGMSRNGLLHRWRLSPALDAETMQLLPERKLFHSQCWKHIEREFDLDPSSAYEVRVIDGKTLRSTLLRMGPPLSGFGVLDQDFEGLVSAVERWACNNKSSTLATWNVAMTGRRV